LILEPGYRVRWRFKASGAIKRSSPALGADGTVDIGRWDRHLHAVLADGRPRWRWETGEFVTSSPAVGPDRPVYIAS